MEAELEKDQDDDVIPVPSENELDEDPGLEALTKMAERNQQKALQVSLATFINANFDKATNGHVEYFGGGGCRGSD